MAEKKINILVVDDEAFIRDMLEAMLRFDDNVADVITAENGLDALEKFKAFPKIDLIVSDMNMPEMDGLEFIKTLRTDNPDIPIIILTGNNEIRVAIDAMRSGASDYLLKDENIEDTIFISIEKVMEKYQLKLENQKLMEDLARKNRELERLSFLDGLTDIANRRYFDKVINEEWRRAERQASPISLIMVDIDYFKLFNDRYGHQEGDICLKKVASAISDSLKRPGDFVARYGGEEFAVILPDTDSKGAVVVAQVMLANVSGLEIIHEDSSVSDFISISLGIGTVLPYKNAVPSTLISMADEALYDAKKQGRNQIKLSDNCLL